MFSCFGFISCTGNHRDRHVLTHSFPPLRTSDLPDWHPGVVGLVAAKVKDAFDRPTVIIGERGKASCRSVDGFDIGTAVIRARMTAVPMSKRSEEQTSELQSLMRLSYSVFFLKKNKCCISIDA